MMSATGLAIYIFDKMRKRIPYIILISIVILIGYGCSRNYALLKLSLDSEVNQVYALSYYAYDKGYGTFIESAVSVQKGAGEVRLPSLQPLIVRVISGVTKIYIYADKGDKVNISGQTGNPLEWMVKGNSINESLSEWRIKNKTILETGDQAKINAAVTEFVTKNRENPASVILLMYRYDRRSDEAGFMKLWKSLSGEAAEPRWSDMVSRSDLLVETDHVKGKHTIIIRGRGSRRDTITTGKVPVVLYFWRNSDDDRQTAIDSLKKLRRQHPDSTKFIIADICFDPDSISWKAPLKRDSLEHTIRGWNPLGETDSAMRALGVTRTPMLITF